MKQLSKHVWEGAEEICASLRLVTSAHAKQGSETGYVRCYTSAPAPERPDFPYSSVSRWPNPYHTQLATCPWRTLTWAAERPLLSIGSTTSLSSYKVSPKPYYYIVTYDWGRAELRPGCRRAAVNRYTPVNHFSRPEGSKLKTRKSILDGGERWVLSRGLGWRLWMPGRHWANATCKTRALTRTQKLVL